MALLAAFLRPRGARLRGGDAPGLGPARLACRRRLVEHPQGRVLVDTGLGPSDAAEPSRVSAAIRAAGRPTPEPDVTAIARLRRAGHDPRDLRHIVMTRVGFDHAGGLPDVLWATALVRAQEARGLASRRGRAGGPRRRRAR